MIIRFFYTMLFIIIAPFFLYGLYKKKNGKPSIGKRWKEHFGFTPALLKTGKKTVWFHTVSLGETIAATPLIKAYHAKYPEHIIVLTTTTTTGAEQATRIGSFIQHRYMPLDLPWAIKRFIRTIKPQKLFIMETELWPNTLATATTNNIEITILNARLSERSAFRYKKLQPIFNLLSKNLNQILCQTQSDAERFLSLGVTVNKVKVTGSLKFDINIPESVIQSGNELRYYIGRKRPVWIVASTHHGEDEIVLNAHQKLLNDFPELLLIIVPRHPERFEQVFQLSLQYGFETITRTSQSLILKKTQVYIADTMGEMLTLIQSADVCFMGGSLIGDKVGGHNLLEPAALAKPCLTGPSFYNFKDITEQLIQAEACQVCVSSEDINKAVQELLNTPDKISQHGQYALSVVKRNIGSLQNTLDYL